MSQLVAVTAELLRSMALPQPAEGSKEERGRVLVIAGSVEVPGAALLAGVAALRAGAGKLQIATVRSIAPHLGLAIPEAMVIGLPETAAGGIERGAAEILGPRAERCHAVLIGPGMVEEEAGEKLVLDILDATSQPAFVLDAGALCGLRACTQALRAHGGRLVVTPHAGEMATLLAVSRDEVEADPLGAARRAAALLRAVVVMKGGCTQIVTPQGEGWSYDGGNVGLATSGSGDTLAGIIVGLLARGALPLQAALWGVYLHGEAGNRLAHSCGMLGFLARELPGEVPRIMAELSA